jgi:hypothetical protein
VRRRTGLIINQTESQRRWHGSPNGADFRAAQRRHSGGEETERDSAWKTCLRQAVSERKLETAVQSQAPRRSTAAAVRRDLREKDGPLLGAPSGRHYRNKSCGGARLKGKLREKTRHGVPLKNRSEEPAAQPRCKYATREGGLKISSSKP